MESEERQREKLARRERKRRRRDELLRCQRALLFEAAKTGLLPRVQHYLAGGGFAVDVEDDSGMTLLHHAVAQRHVAVAEWLLSAGADVNRHSRKHGLTALHFACAANDAEMAALLVAHGADANLASTDGVTPAELGLRRLLQRFRRTRGAAAASDEDEEGARADAAPPTASEPGGGGGGGGGGSAYAAAAAAAAAARAWEEKLRDEAAEEEGFAWGDWMREMEAEEPTVNDEEYRAYVRRELDQRRHTRERDRQGAFAFESARAQAARARAEAEREARRLQDEEISRAIAAREAALAKARASASKESERQRLEREESEWRAFEAGTAELCFADVPWPRLPPHDGAGSSGGGGGGPVYLWELLRADAELGEDERRKLFRKAYLRWHPDKFAQTFGARLAARDRERVLAAVNRVAQYIGSVKDKLGAAPP